MLVSVGKLSTNITSAIAHDSCYGITIFHRHLFKTHIIAFSASIWPRRGAACFELNRPTVETAICGGKFTTTTKISSTFNFTGVSWVADFTRQSYWEFGTIGKQNLQQTTNKTNETRWKNAGTKRRKRSWHDSKNALWGYSNLFFVAGTGLGIIFERLRFRTGLFLHVDPLFHYTVWCRFERSLRHHDREEER